MRVQGRRCWRGLNRSYLMPLLLVGAILRQVAFLLAPETPSLAQQLAPLGVNLHLGIRSLGRVPLPPVIAWPVILLGARRTCHATCCWSAAGGSIGPLVQLEWSLVVVARFEVGLSIDTVLGAFLVHGDDARLPFGVVARNAKPDVGDGSGVVVGNALPHRFYQHPSVALVVEMVGELGLTLHLSEEEVGGPVILSSPIFFSCTSLMAGSRNCSWTMAMDLGQSGKRYRGPPSKAGSSSSSLSPSAGMYSYSSRK